MAHAWVEVDLEAVRNNVRILKEAQPSWVELIAVVKANAYGHGALPVSRAVLEAGAGRLAVSFPGEAVELREGAIGAPILLLGSFETADIDGLLRYEITPSLWDLAQARLLSERAKRAGRRMRVHVQVDTGLTRLGVDHEAAAAFVRDIRDLGGLVLEGIHTHFGSAEEEDPGFALLQQRRFRKVLAQLAADGVRIPVVHCQSSSSLFSVHEPGMTAVRPGLALYGLLPGQGTLQPALSFKTRVAQVRKVPAGTFVGEGRTWKAPAERGLATLSVGFADGFPRALSNQGQVLIRGKRYRVAGRVTMDHVVVDLGRDPEIQVGDVATLIGRDGQDAIGASELAASAGTVHHELVTSITQRVPRQYREARANLRLVRDVAEESPTIRRVATR